MSYLTLNEAKAQCNIDLDFLDDDYYLQELIDAAEISVALRINDDLANHVTGGALVKTLKRGVAFLVGQWYAHREPVIAGTIVAKVPFTFDDIIQDYIKHQLK